jgi:hypothetical protein
MTADPMTNENRKRQETKKIKRWESRKKKNPEKVSTHQVQLDTNGKVGDEAK